MNVLLTENTYCRKLATYLLTFLNEQFEKEIATSSGTVDENTICVRSFRDFDDFSVPLSEFPLLKVYPNRDIYKKGTPFRIVTGTITYSVSYPNLKVLPNLLSWVSYQINLGLLHYSKEDQHLLPPPNNESYVAEYLLSANELTNTVYSFLRFSFQYKDFVSNCGYQV